MTNPHPHNPRNRASTVLAKIGGGEADEDFARAVEEAVDAVTDLDSKAKITLTVTIHPRKDMGCVEMRAEVVSKIPRPAPAATHMHLGANGELLTQQEFMLEEWSNGGAKESPQPVKTSAGSDRLKPVVSSSDSGTFKALPPRGPITQLPPSAPVIPTTPTR